ncbi:hypothetical protein DYB25_007347, partial [Aphanomyces astaci]
PYQYFQRGFSLPQVPARKEPGDLRVVFISDTHSLHDDLPPIPHGDVLVHGGDFTDTGDRDEVRYVLAFNAFLGTLPHRYKIVIGGNHECTFDKAYYKTHWKRYGHPVEYDSDDVRSLLTNALYLEDSLWLFLVTLYCYVVHEGYGTSFDGTTIFVNGSNCTDEYKAINPVIVFDLPPRMASVVDDSTHYHTKMALQLQRTRDNVFFTNMLL